MTDENVIKLDEQQPAFCPNCNKPAIRRGMVIDCENCNATFRFTPEGPKVKSIGKIDELEERVTALEEVIKPQPLPPAEPPKEKPAESDDDL